MVEHTFGGKYDTQFKTTEQIRSFLQAFHDMFNKRGIDSKHLHPLLYLILFLKEDVEQQGIANERFNTLLDYARFIVDLIINCSSHIQQMDKRQDYQRVYDESTNEFFFAKSELVETMSHEDLLEFVPKEDQADDVVKYLRVKLLDNELYVPRDLVINIGSTRMLKGIDGQKIPQIDLPMRFRSDILSHTLGAMLGEHKANNTIFYQELSKETIDPSELKKIYNQYKKRATSNTNALTQVGILVGDYVKDNAIYKTKIDIAGFLFEYFALFKAFKFRKPITIPEDYSRLTQFYIEKGITKETVRMMMKDVGEI